MLGRSPSWRSERGAALLIVLWMLLLMSLLAAAFVATSRADLDIARNSVETAQVRALADAGVARAAVALGEGDPNLRWRADGTPYRWAFGGGIVVVSIVAETGKIDLNTAPADVITRLFRSAGASDELSARLVRAVLDRRAAQIDTSTDVSGPTAAIDPNAPAFASIEGLGALPGMTAPLLHAVLPLVTVYSRASTIDPLTAPRSVLLTLPGAEASDVDIFLAARQDLATGNGPTPVPPPSIARYLAGAPVSAVTVRAAARIETGASFVREALIIVRDAQGAPYIVREWSRGLAAE